MSQTLFCLFNDEQCDQMVRLLLFFLPIMTMKIYPMAYHFAKVGSKSYLILINGEQCDQMVRFVLIFLPFTTIKIYPMAYRSFLPK